jgi:acetylornithine deacetylase/succinyl-diaminopimelate desuccinylase-like protein
VISSETCTVDGGCTTVSGDDQKELRGELGQHVAELRGCFSRDDATTKVAVDLRIEGGRAAQVSTHEENAVATCVAAIVGALGYPGDDRTVTLAFSRD